MIEPDLAEHELVEEDLQVLLVNGVSRTAPVGFAVEDDDLVIRDVDMVQQVRRVRAEDHLYGLARELSGGHLAQ